jgi:hypothetical protein
MAALAQLGAQLGGGYQQARDTQTEEKNELALKQQANQRQQEEMGLRLKEYLLRSALQQDKETGPGQKVGTVKIPTAPGAPEEYGVIYQNPYTGKTVTKRLGPGVLPEDMAKSEMVQSDIGASQKTAQDAAAKRSADQFTRTATQQERMIRLREHLQEQLQSYKAAHPTIKATSAKESAAIQLRERQAQWVIRQGNSLLTALNDPEILDAIGPVQGLITEGELYGGVASKKVANFNTALRSFIALQPALHGARGVGMMREFYASIPAWLRSNPDALIGAIDSLIQTSTNYFADDVAKIDPAQAILMMQNMNMTSGSGTLDPNDQPPKGDITNAMPPSGGMPSTAPFPKVKLPPPPK